MYLRIVAILSLVVGCKSKATMVQKDSAPHIRVVNWRYANLTKKVNGGVLFVRHGYGNQYDTVKFVANNGFEHHFYAKGRDLIDTLFEPIDISGKFLYKDLLGNRSWAHSKTYYSYFKAYPKVENVYYLNSTPKSRIDYTKSPIEEKQWYESGIMKFSNSDGIRESYNPQGVLIERLKANEEWKFWNSGIIKQLIKDTWVKNNRVQHVMDFNEKGIIQDEKYFLNDTPCLEWREFNQNGSLKKTIFKSHIEFKNLSEPDEFYENTIFVNVNTNPQFPGGLKRLEEYINKQWNQKLNMNHADTLKMSLLLTIKRDGRISVEEEGIDASGQELIRIIRNTSGQWIAAEEMGKKVEKKIEILFEINE